MEDRIIVCFEVGKKDHAAIKEKLLNELSKFTIKLVSIHSASVQKLEKDYFVTVVANVIVPR